MYIINNITKEVYSIISINENHALIQEYNEKLYLTIDNVVWSLYT